jgi:hypothetical protein
MINLHPLQKRLQALRGRPAAGWPVKPEKRAFIKRDLNKRSRRMEGESQATVKYVQAAIKNNTGFRPITKKTNKNVRRKIEVRCNF